MQLHNEDKYEEVSRQLVNLRKKRDDIKYASLSSILNENLEDEELVKFQKSYPLLYYFLVNSHIDKDYYKYKGHFKEGHMTSDDKKFLALIKSKQKVQFTFKIVTPGQVIESLVTDDFLNESVLNFELMKYLHESNDERFERIVQKHTNKNDFIIGYLHGLINENKTNNKALIEHLMLSIYHNSKGIGKYINRNKDSLKEYYDSINYFVGYNLSNTMKFKRNSNNEYLYDYLLTHTKIVDILPYSNLKSLQKKLLELFDEEKKIRHLTLDKKYKSFYEFLYENNLYEFNLSNLLIFIDLQLNIHYEKININDFLDHLKEKKLKTLLETVIRHRFDFFELIDQFDKPENLYEKNFCFIISEICDPAADVYRLFNSLDENIIITDIENIPFDYWPILMEKRRLSSTYHNVLTYLERYDIDGLFVEYFDEVYSNLKPLDDAITLNQFNEIYTLINYFSKESILSKVQLDTKELSYNAENLLDIDKIIQIIGFGFNVKFTKKLVDFAKTNDELLTILVTKYTSEIINYPTVIMVNTFIMKEVYMEIDHNQFNRLLKLQIDSLEQKHRDDYLADVLSVFSREHFLKYLHNINNTNTRYYVANKYFLNNDIERETLIQVMPIVDDIFNEFSTREHFSIEPNENVKYLLDTLKEMGNINCKLTSTGRIEIWVYKEKK